MNVKKKTLQLFTPFLLLATSFFLSKSCSSETVESIDTQFIIGWSHACITLDNTSTVLIDSKLKCWGSNEVGQLGQGNTLARGDGSKEMGDNLSYTSVGSNLHITQLSAGKYHTCAILYNRNSEERTPFLKCWGSNSFGQLGQGDTTHRGNTSGQMGDNLSSIDLGTNLVPTQITSGDFFTCAILDDNSTPAQETYVKCWGRNNAGQLGYGHTDNLGDNSSEMGDYLQNVNLGSNVRVRAINSNGESSCAIIDNTSTTIEEGLLKCWGENGYGQLGLGNSGDKGDGTTEMGDNLSYVDLGEGIHVLQVAVGGQHACAVLDNYSTSDVDYSVKCWGRNDYGTLAQGSFVDRGDNANEMGNNLRYSSLGSNIRVIKVASGGEASCAIMDDLSTSEPERKIKCWGRNIYGELGIGSTATKGGTSGTIGDNLGYTDLGTGINALNIALGFYYACAVLDNSSTPYLDLTVKCWGYNSSGQLGIGNTQKKGDGSNEMGNNLAYTNLGSDRTIITAPVF